MLIDKGYLVIGKAIYAGRPLPRREILLRCEFTEAIVYILILGRDKATDPTNQSINQRLDREIRESFLP